MEKDNSTLKLILIGAAIVLVPVILFAGIFFFNNDDSAGASTMQTVDVTNSAHAQSIQALDTLLDPLKAIAKKADSVDAAKTTLDGLKVMLESNQTPFCTIDSSGKCVALSDDVKGKIMIEFNKLDSYLNLLQTKAQNPNNTTDITKVQKDITTSMQAIRTLVFGGTGAVNYVIQLAQTIATYNQTGSTAGNIPYKLGGANILMNGSKETGVDCSGFMDYLLKKSGVTTQGSARLNTRSIIALPAGFTLVTQSKEDYKSSLQPGDLIVKHLNGDDGSWHVGMYIGPDVSTDRNIIESTGTQRKMPYTRNSGPQFSKIDSFTSPRWLANSGSNIWVVRPPYR